MPSASQPRFRAVAFGAATLAAAVCFTALGQEGFFRQAKRSSESEGRVKELRDGVKPSGVAKEQIKKDYETVAAWLVNRLTWPEYYNPVTTGDPKTIDTSKNLPALIEAAHRYRLISTATSKFNAVQREYINDFAAALDHNLKDVIQSSAPPVVKLQATQMLSDMALSGSPNHAATITELISNTNTPDLVRYRAYTAAGNLLTAVDTFDPVPIQLGRLPHTVKEDALVNLLKALTSPITTEAKTADGTPPEQAEVVRVIRREAVRALGKYRFVSVRDQNDKPLALPALTLLKVAVSDPSIKPAPSLTERIEAIIGFCKMAPDAAYSTDYAAANIAAGLIGVFRVKNNDPNDQSILWKIYAGRLVEAMNAWKANTRNLAGDRNPKVVADLADVAVANVLTPISEGGNARANLQRLEAWLQANPARSASLFKDVADSKVTPAVAAE
jgi:hypothetical protein